jgi:hypothetical protein
MACLAFLCATGLVMAHVVSLAFFCDTRSSALLAGSGQPSTWVGAESVGGFVSSCRNEMDQPHMYCLEGNEMPRLSFLLVHDIFEHSGSLLIVAKHLFRACEADGFRCNVYGLDLGGHGKTAAERLGDKGHFDMRSWVDQVRIPSQGIIALVIVS